MNLKYWTLMFQRLPEINVNLYPSFSINCNAGEI